MAKTSGTGQGGKSFQDRQLAAEVRSLTLEKIKIILSRAVVEMNAQDKQLHDELLLKLAGTILPRLNEVTGTDGESLVIQISSSVAKKNGINSSAG